MQVAVARGLAETTAGTAVTVNTVLPGPTRSEGIEQFVASMAKAKGASTDDVEKEFLSHDPPELAAPTLRNGG
jgi:NAD(P)-dependent dehydrogenase (short-subunit alcohol dehydrogenase family)